MPRDSSLDEFVSVSAETNGRDEADAGGTDDAEAVEDSDEPVPDDVDADPVDDHERSDALSDADLAPIESTYAWSSDPGFCERCGGDAASRWRCDGELVCAACKDW